MNTDGGGWTSLFEDDLVTTYTLTKGVYPQWEYSNNYNHYDSQIKELDDRLFEGKNIENIKTLLKRSNIFKYIAWDAGSPIDFLSDDNQIVFSASGNSSSEHTYNFEINPSSIPVKFKSFMGTGKTIAPAIDCENNYNSSCPTPSGYQKLTGSFLIR